MENLLLKTPYKFKISYGGTPEPQTAPWTAQDAPWLHGSSLKILNLVFRILEDPCTVAHVVDSDISRYVEICRDMSRHVETCRDMSIPEVFYSKSEKTNTTKQTLF